MLKLMDIEAFGTSYKKYDFISSQFDSWIYIYPFFELVIGISFLNSSPPSPIIKLAKHKYLIKSLLNTNT